MKAAILLAVAAVTLWAFGTRYSRPDAERVKTWRTAVAIFADNPVFGVGPDGFEDAFTERKPADFGRDVAANAHNDILQVLSTTGLLGMVGYAFVLFGAFLHLRGPALGGAAALFVAAKFNPVPLEAMVLVAVVCGLSGGFTVGDFKPFALFMACAVVALAAPVVIADYYAAKGEIQAAARLNPYELTYKARVVRVAADHYNKTGEPSALEVIRHEVAEAKKHRPGAAMTARLAGVIR